MKRYYNIFLNIALLLFLGACSQEAPFIEDKEEGEGRFLSSALSVEVSTDERLVRSESDGVPDVADFTVAFYDADHPDVVVKSFTYGSMPEVVTLPVADYIVKAYYGGTYGADDSKAAFGAPYYLGESNRFSVAKDMIIDTVDPIVCRLSNVRVTILFDEKLVAAMDEDAKVSVRVGQSGALDFTKATDKSGYFAFDEGSNTMSAEFSGVINGEPVIESKSYDNVKPGNHYRITFKLHAVDPQEPGGINPGDEGSEIKVDASIQLDDFSGNGGSDVGEPGDNEIYMEDDRYPKNEPDEPDDPGTDTGSGPQITAREPINLDDWNIAVDGLKCVLDVHSDSGITRFKVKIDSPKLTDEVLTGVGLAAEFDLVTGKTAAGVDVKEGLESLNLPVGDNVKGQKDVVFDVSKFMGLLGIYGAADHLFILTVTDAENNTTVKKLKLRTE